MRTSITGFNKFKMLLMSSIHVHGENGGGRPAFDAGRNAAPAAAQCYHQVHGAVLADQPAAALHAPAQLLLPQHAAAVLAVAGCLALQQVVAHPCPLYTCHGAIAQQV